jgi:hypothetical protein
MVGEYTTSFLEMNAIIKKDINCITTQFENVLFVILKPMFLLTNILILEKII